MPGLTTGEVVSETVILVETVGVVVLAVVVASALVVATVVVVSVVVAVVGASHCCVFYIILWQRGRETENDYRSEYTYKKHVPTIYIATQCAVFDI